MTSRCLLSLFLVLSIAGCRNVDDAFVMSKLDEFIDLNRKTYHFSSKQGWELQTIFEGIRENTIDVTFLKEEVDTTKSLGLYIDLSSELGFIESYQKNYFSEGKEIELLMKKDTFYCFEQLEDKKEFIVGAYNYRFSTMRMKPEELNFYLVYKDSLGRVRGSDLPKLPYLSDSIADLYLK